jgi:hypothetical protein
VGINLELESLFGNDSNPYYLWAPSWTESSAGVRGMHYLCHALNCLGAHAFILPAESLRHGRARVNPYLNTPILTKKISDVHISSGRVPIAVYPEDVIGNPVHAPIVVRFLWNYAGALGGPSVFDEDEIVYAFSRNIAKHYETTGRKSPGVLFVPPIDPSEFVPSESKKPFQVVYAGKYRAFVGEPPAVGSLPTVEIFRDGPQKQPRQLVKRLLSDATVVFSFENSSIVTEAILSGTPAGFIPNSFMTEVIAEHELSSGGSFIGDNPRDIEAARLSIPKGIAAYKRLVEEFPKELKQFFLDTQVMSRQVPFDGEIDVPEFASPITKNRVLLGLNMIKTKGVRVFLREVVRFFRSRV